MKASHRVAVCSRIMVVAAVGILAGLILGRTGLAQPAERTPAQLTESDLLEFVSSPWVGMLYKRTLEFRALPNASELLRGWLEDPSRSGTWTNTVLALAVLGQRGGRSSFRKVDSPRRRSRSRLQSLPRARGRTSSARHPCVRGQAGWAAVVKGPGNAPPPRPNGASRPAREWSGRVSMKPKCATI